jgi:hypothetical protein
VGKKKRSQLGSIDLEMTRDAVRAGFRLQFEDWGAACLERDRRAPAGAVSAAFWLLEGPDGGIAGTGLVYCLADGSLYYWAKGGRGQGPPPAPEH